ncbi:hypothetical protein BGZ49_001054, partial [Haplosporangium sp. Z 27]
LQHGLWGNVRHVNFIAEQLKQGLGNRILVYRAHSNQNSHTYDGVDICGQRLVQEIHEVIKVIEEGGDVKQMKGHRRSRKRHVKNKVAMDFTTMLRNGKRKVTQFSFVGYSLGGIVGRFAIGILELEGFFERIKPMFYVTMASPHLGIHHPNVSKWSKFFNYLTKHALNRTGLQMQLDDDYVDHKPILLVMSEPSSVFMHGLARFKRRAIYSNIQNDVSVPFWSASFSDANPFEDLESMEIKYSSGYSSLIESFEPRDTDAVLQRKREHAELLKAAPFRKRTAIKLKEVPWKKYFIYSMMGPFFPVIVVLAAITITIQGTTSKIRTNLVEDPEKNLKNMKDPSVITRTNSPLVDQSSNSTFQSVSTHHPEDQEQSIVQSEGQNQESSTDTGTSVESIPQSSQTDLSTTPASNLEPCHDASCTSNSTITSNMKLRSESKSEQDHAVSFSYPELKLLRPLSLLPVQIEISKNLNKLEWKKNIIHINAFNAHASLVVREKRFTNDGGVAVVRHVVDMFRDEGEDV